MSRARRSVSELVSGLSMWARAGRSWRMLVAAVMSSISRRCASVSTGGRVVASVPMTPGLSWVWRRRSRFSSGYRSRRPRKCITSWARTPSGAVADQLAWSLSGPL